mmetsp:Transcript_1075/g.3409  ORF Transcript_1075/g.3409 Transcript_1075/m.3409 type:complete len:311 (-) Transcript_1075:25-957(-)
MLEFYMILRDRVARGLHAGELPKEEFGGQAEEVARRAEQRDRGERERPGRLAERRRAVAQACAEHAQVLEPQVTVRFEVDEVRVVHCEHERERRADEADKPFCKRRAADEIVGEDPDGERRDEEEQAGQVVRAHGKEEEGHLAQHHHERVFGHRLVLVPEQPHDRERRGKDREERVAERCGREQHVHALGEGGEGQVAAHQRVREKDAERGAGDERGGNALGSKVLDALTRLVLELAHRDAGQVFAVDDRLVDDRLLWVDLALLILGRRLSRTGGCVQRSRLLHKPLAEEPDVRQPDREARSREEKRDER